MSDQSDLLLRIERAKTLIDQRQFSRAERTLAGVVQQIQSISAKEEPVCSGAYKTIIRLAEILHQAQKFARAAHLYRQAQEIQRYFSAGVGDNLHLHMRCAQSAVREKNFSQAEKHYQRALALAEEWCIDGTIVAVLEEIALFHEEHGKTTRQVVALEKLLRATERFHPKDAVALGRIYRRLGLNLQQLRRFPEAMKWLQRSLTAQAKLGSNGQTEACILYCLMASVQRDRGQLDIAQDYLRKASASLPSGENDPTPNIALLEQRGISAYDSLKYEAARVLFCDALKLLAESGGADSLQYAQLQSRLAMTYFSVHDNERARELLEQSLYIFRFHGASTCDEAGKLLNKLSGIYRIQRRFVESSLLLDGFEEIQAQATDKASRMSYVCYFEEAIEFHNNGDFDKAWELYQRALEVLPSLNTARSIEVAAICLRVFNLMLLRKKPGEADNYLQRARQIVQQTFGFQEPDIASGAHTLVRAYLLQGKDDYAESFLMLALTEATSMGLKAKEIDVCHQYASLLDEQDRPLDANRLRVRAQKVARKRSGRQLRAPDSAL